LTTPKDLYLFLIDVSIFFGTNPVAMAPDQYLTPCPVGWQFNNPGFRAPFHLRDGSGPSAPEAVHEH
jgi:hypothetical protein